MADALTGWDTQSGIRERLALLAIKGPEFHPNDYGYHPSKDFWYYCGANGGRHVLQVKQEGSASLALIQEKWNIARHEAMALIGYPEKR